MKAILQSNRARAVLITVAALLGSPAALAADVRLCTNYGAVDVEIDERAAPRHAANFLAYVESGFYDGTIIHRIVPGTMVQGGRFDPSFSERTPNAPIANESTNGLGNRRGTIAAARSEDPNSASSQFFFNLTDNSHLDGSIGSPGYTVFGRVTAGLDALDTIAELPNQVRGSLQDVPVGLVEIQSAAVLDRSPVFGLSIEPDPAQLSADFDRVSARGDSAGTLAALDAMKRSCAGLDPAQIVAAAEAAIALRQTDRARYLLEPYLARADLRDPSRPAAESLVRSLEAGPANAEPRPASRNSNVFAGDIGPDIGASSRDATELTARCRRPIAPSVPNGNFVERFALQAVERSVLQFRQSSEQYLNCVRQVLDSTNLDDNESTAVTRLYNDMVIELTAVSIRFNQAVANFREAQTGRLNSN
jgi:cyclophilin family peptidyl-prolyl cis-trans isomerase